MITESDVTRRTFIKVMGGFGASLVLGSFTMPGCTKSEAAANKGVTFAPNAFVKIDPEGIITVTIARSDMGQGVRTTLAMIVAEELDADWSKVRVQQADGDDSKYGHMGTGGSSSVRSTYGQLRQLGATSRHMLVAAAAQDWKVDPSECITKEGKVIHESSGKSVAYGDLTASAAAIGAPDGRPVKVKDSSKFSIIGKATNRVDNLAVVTGKAIYGIDAKIEGMKYAVIARTPAFGASVKSFDDTAAKAVPGVSKVFKISSGVAVVADNTWAAIKGRDALKVDWNLGDSASVSTDSLRAAMKAAIGDHAPMPAGKEVTATYELPYVAHATMEPMNAVASVTKDRCVIWAPTQSPDSGRRQVARELGIPPENVELNVTLLGGGFGRRSNNDFISETIQTSKVAECPIKLIWTREDDMKHDVYRPMSHHALKGSLDGSGNPIGWSHQFLQAGEDRGSGYQDEHLPYKIDNAKGLHGGVDSPVPTGAWRSVEHSQVIFAQESFIDELAHAAGKDALEFRKALIKDPRLLKVMETAAERSGWGKPLPAGSGRGLAVFQGYGSYIAHVVELTVKGNSVKLDKVTAVVDVGLAINPKGVEAQVQSGCSDGLSLALTAAITINKGGVVQNSWDDYNWMTFDAVPPMDITIISGGPDPGGMGEVGVPSTAPAVANAIFAATGKRVRKLPIKIEELA